MTWLIIVVVLLAAFGPVLWLVPSRRDRRLAKLRQAARSEGLTVALEKIPHTHPSAAQRVSSGGVVRDPVVECAAYGHTSAKKLNRLPGVRLLKQPEAVDGPFPGWVLNPHVPRTVAHLARLLDVIEPLLAELPEDALGIEIEPRNLTIYWLEGPGSGPEEVTRIAAILRSLEAELARLEATIEAELADDDS